MIDAKIVDIDLRDLRFPRRKVKRIKLTNVNPIYICVYVTLVTDVKKYKGYALTCELGEGVESVLAACKLLFNLVKNRNVAEIYSDFASLWRILTTNKEVISPLECSMMHIATAAIVNALWDLWARIEGKPVWKLLTHMTPEQLVSTVDFTYISSAVTEEEAIDMLKKREARKEELEKTIQKTGYPAYAADGWTGCKYSQIYSFSKRYVKSGFETFKIDIDNDEERRRPATDIQSCFLTRRVIGWRKRKLIVHMNQALPSQAIAFTVVETISSPVRSQRAQSGILRPYCVENAMSPYNVLECFYLKSQVKHCASLCIGETCSSSVVAMQLLRMMTPTFWHVNVARMGGINEALAVYFLAEKTKTPVWGYANGAGLGEMIQHLQMWDYVCLSQTINQRLIQFVDQQHGYFERPVFIQNGKYMPPKFPGYSTKLKDKCIARWSYPEGTRWKHLLREESPRSENEEQNIGLATRRTNIRKIYTEEREHGKRVNQSCKQCSQAV